MALLRNLNFEKLVQVKKIVRKLIWTCLVVFVLMNVIAFYHAYKFTHFVTSNVTKTNNPEKLNYYDKFKTLLVGINNPRPTNKLKPNRYLTIQLQSHVKLDCWYYKNSDSAKGTVVLFHGYSGDKSSLLDKAEIFEKLNYNTLLVDFMGSGGSEGNRTTLGFKEAEEVKSVYDYLIDKGEHKIYLYGNSMGSVAVMKSISEYKLNPKGIIIECPFGSLYQTICARFRLMNVPPFPMAGLLVFWGGLQNDFWGFGHEPTKYAKKINCPTLLLYGDMDRNVSRQEINEIYNNLQGTKVLKTYKLAGHENYLLKYNSQWTDDITQFMNDN